MRIVFACLILLLLCAGPVRADVTNTEATVTWTNVINGVTNGDTITVNGSLRRYTNGVLNDPALWILSTNIVGHAATNTVIHFNTYGSGLGIDHISFSTADSGGTHLTNAARFVSIIGSNLTITLSAGVGTVTYTTNVFSQYRPVVHPAAALPTAAARTNNQSGLWSIMGDNYATNLVPNSVPGLTNLLDRVSYQESTNKVFRSTTNYGGLLDGARATNFTSLSGSNGTFADLTLQRGSLSNAVGITGTNASLTNVTLRHFKLIDGRPEGTNAGITNGYTVALTNINSVSSNHVNFGSALRSENDIGANTFQLGSNAVALSQKAMAIGNNAFASNSSPTLGSMAVGNSAIATNVQATAVGDSALASGISATAVGLAAQATADSATALGTGANASAADSTAIGESAAASKNGAVALGSDAIAGLVGNYAIALGFNSKATNTAAVALGVGAVSSNANTIVLGTASYRTHIPGFLDVEGGLTNLLTQSNSTNILRGDMSLPRSTVTTVADGHNTINVATNVYVDLTGSPTAAWTWGGITGGNRDGKMVVVVNNTGWAADILHNSGTEPTAALRITTPTGTNITLNNAGTAWFIYNPSSSRWILLNVFNTATPAASATNALASLSTNGTQVTAAWTNENRIYGHGMSIKTTNTSGNVDTEFAISISTNGAIPLFINNAKPALTNQPSFEGNYLADELLFPRTNAAGTDIALSANWSFAVPTDYATNTATLRIIHSITATNGPNASNVVWRASFLHSESGSTTDLRVGTFGTAYLVTNSWAACFNCTNQAAISTIAFTNQSGLSPGGLGILKLERVSTSDTYVGAASLIGLQIDYGK